MFEPVDVAGPTGRRRRRPRLSDDAASYVRELVLSGQLKSGAFIRPEAVADVLGISATPVREGMLLLRSEGFLEIEPRRGFVVAPLSSADINDMFQAQSLLAGELAARAAARMEEKDVAALEEVQARLERAAKDGNLVLVEDLNFEFHRTLYGFAEAPKILWLLRATLSYAPRRFYSAIGGWPAATVHDHREILAALKKSRAEAARDAMSRHIQGAGHLLTLHLENSNVSSGSSEEPAPEALPDTKADQGTASARRRRAKAG